MVRLKSFPVEMLGQIKCIDCGFLDSFESDIEEIIRGILKTGEKAVDNP